MAKLGEQQVIVTWKDVSVELPEDGQEVIVALLDETIVGSGKFTREYDHAIYEEHKDQGYIDSEGRCWDTRNDWPEGQRWWVTHWMSMPEIDDNPNPYLDLYEPEGKPLTTEQVQAAVANYANDVKEMCEQQEQMLDDAIRRHHEGDMSVFDGFWSRLKKK